MDITIFPGKLTGHIRVIESKSQAHRLLICAAFADRPTTLLCRQTNRDIEATAECLRALGAQIRRTEEGYLVFPICAIPERAVLYPRDSGSTLRFLLPIVGALGVDTTFILEGRLAQRPLSPLWEEMERMGCSLSRPTDDTVRCQGKLRCGQYTIDGSISSQFITGLLLAASQISGESRILLTGKVESKPYITMTQTALLIFGLDTSDFRIRGGRLHSPGTVQIEGDWSNGAFFLAAQNLGNDIIPENLCGNSPQGDRAVTELLPDLEKKCTISAADIPDLVPILSVVAAFHQGAIFTDIGRLRLKESDRVSSVVEMIKRLGGSAEATEDRLTVYGVPLSGGTVDSVNDHRIAMSAAIAATACKNPVTIQGAQCVEKSYPTFFEEYRRLGGKYEQYLR